MIFIFPWATVFANKELIATEPRWGTFSLIEMFVFVGILILGLVYVWYKGDLEWIKPIAKAVKTDVDIPLSVYETVNNTQSAYKVRTYENVPQAATLATANTIANVAPASPKPRFKPTFKKPDTENG